MERGCRTCGSGADAGPIAEPCGAWARAGRTASINICAAFAATDTASNTTGDAAATVGAVKYLAAQPVHAAAECSHGPAAT